MNLQPWTERAIGRLRRLIEELEDADPDEEILGLCVVAYRSNASGELYSSLSACCGPRCSPADMAGALRDQAADYFEGRVVTTDIDPERAN